MTDNLCSVSAAALKRETTARTHRGDEMGKANTRARDKMDVWLIPRQVHFPMNAAVLPGIISLTQSPHSGWTLSFCFSRVVKFANRVALSAAKMLRACLDSGDRRLQDEWWRYSQEHNRKKSVFAEDLSTRCSVLFILARSTTIAPERHCLFAILGGFDFV